MPTIAASAVRIPKDAKLSPNIEIPPTIKHPEKVQAIARVMCHSHFGFHRLAIINNSVVLFDHDLTHEEEWKELGGKPSRCSVTLKCMQNQSFSGLPDAFRPYMEIAKRKRYDRRRARDRAYMRRQRLNEGGDLVLPETKDTVSGEWLFVPSDGMRGGGKRVSKCFPLIPRWNGTVKFVIFDNKITKEVFSRVLHEAGMLIGIGRFRPCNCGYYGRFSVEDIKWEEK